MPGQDPVKLRQAVWTWPFGPFTAGQTSETLHIEVLSSSRKFVVERANDTCRLTQSQRGSDEHAEEEENDADNAETKRGELTIIKKEYAAANSRHKKAA